MQEAKRWRTIEKNNNKQLTFVRKNTSNALLSLPLILASVTQLHSLLVFLLHRRLLLEGAFLLRGGTLAVLDHLEVLVAHFVFVGGAAAFLHFSLRLRFDYTHEVKKRIVTRRKNCAMLRS